MKENKDPYRRGINKAGITSTLDSGVKEKKGKREELKILETHNKQRIKKELLLIRKFLGMSIDELVIHDQRITKIKKHKL